MSFDGKIVTITTTLDRQTRASLSTRNPGSAIILNEPTKDTMRMWVIKGENDSAVINSAALPHLSAAVKGESVVIDFKMGDESKWALEETGTEGVYKIKELSSGKFWKADPPGLVLSEINASSSADEGTEWRIEVFSF